MKKYIVLALFLLVISKIEAQTQITEQELKKHIGFLASDDNSGRYPGEKSNKKIVRYIQSDMKKSGIKTSKQAFTAQLRNKKGTPVKPKVKTWNIIGVIEGNDDHLKNEYIVLGAHYDHLGMGGGPSTKSDQIGIHHGADDNASGTAALMEIGEKLAANKKQLKRSVILIAFGAEEQGLLGSRYFTENPIVPISSIKVMINMDMVGRLNSQKHVYMGGAGTFPKGEDFMRKLGLEAGVAPMVHAGSVGGSDHVSFYKKEISVLGMHTGGHDQYHTPEDTIDLINFPGQKMVCEYIYNTIMGLSNYNTPFEFILQD